MNLADINSKILEKIDSMDIEKNKKNFLKEVLIEEYNRRDKNFYNLINKRNENYGPLIEKYYK